MRSLKRHRSSLVLVAVAAAVALVVGLAVRASAQTFHDPRGTFVLDQPVQFAALTGPGVLGVDGAGNVGLAASPFDLVFHVNQSSLPFEGEDDFFTLNYWLLPRTDPTDTDGVVWEWEAGPGSYTSATLDFYVYTLSGQTGIVTAQITQNGSSTGITTSAFTTTSSTRYTASGSISVAPGDRVGLRLLGATGSATPIAIRGTAHVRLLP